MSRPQVPFSAVKAERADRRALATVVLICLVSGLGSYVSVRGALEPSRFATPVAGLVGVIAVVCSVFFTYTLRAGYRARVGWHVANGCLFGVGTGVMVFGFAIESWHLSPAVAGGLAVYWAVGTALFSVRWTSQHSRESLAMGRSVRPRSARDTYAACRSLLDGGQLSADESKSVRLTLASAAIARYSAGEAPDGLVEATDVLRELIKEPAESWAHLLAAVVALVEANSVKADQHGDLSGYEESVRLLADAAAWMPPDLGAMALLHAMRGQYQVTLAGRLLPAPEGEALLAQAIASLRLAIGAVSPRLRSLRGFRATLHAGLGTALATSVMSDGADLGVLDTAIAECRTAIRLAGHWPRARVYSQLSLADLLTQRAQEVKLRVPDDTPAQVRREFAAAVRADLAEAERLTRRARRYGGPSARDQARASLAGLTMTRASIFESRTYSDRRAIQAWRSAALTADRHDLTRQVQVGQSWVSSAELTENVQWCAEAYDFLMRVIPLAVAVRYLPGERDRVLADVQATAEEAGYWLAEAGRVGEAALALELGRAVSLTEVLSRDRPDIELALRQAGRADLAERYRNAVDDYRAATRPDRFALDGHQDYPQRAWSAFQVVLREVAPVAGVDLPGAAPTLDELADAAREGPLVYLAAASRGGYAIVVPAGGRPRYVPLPVLTRAEVSSRIPRFLRATQGVGAAGPAGARGAPGAHGAAQVMAEVEVTARWLWVAGIGRLARELPAGALVTIVPVGLLSQLPVHAAGCPTAPGQDPWDWEFLADKVTVRYAHNARTLLHARTVAAGLAEAELSPLLVAVPELGGSRSLQFAAREVSQISRLWEHATVIADGAYQAVEQALAKRTVWHFACHCDTRPDSILDSALLLEGGELTLREILAWPAAPRRLAVLSACGTHWSGSDLLDEGMGLPAGLLQAGFAGVVASHWPVADRSTADLMTSFHELWHQHGLPPAVALAEAQRRLRAGSRVVWRHPFFWAPFALTGS